MHETKQHSHNFLNKTEVAAFPSEAKEIQRRAQTLLFEITQERCEEYNVDTSDLLDIQVIREATQMLLFFDNKEDLYTRFPQLRKKSDNSHRSLEAFVDKLIENDFCDYYDASGKQHVLIYVKKTTHNEIRVRQLLHELSHAADFLALQVIEKKKQRSTSQDEVTTLEQQYTQLYQKLYDKYKIPNELKLAKIAIPLTAAEFLLLLSDPAIGLLFSPLTLASLVHSLYKSNFKHYFLRSSEITARHTEDRFEKSNSLKDKIKKILSKF